MNKDSISIAACVLSVFSIGLSSVAVMRSGSSAEIPQTVPVADYEKASKETGERFTFFGDSLSEQRQATLKRDTEQLKRIIALEKQAGIAPPASN